MTQTTTADASVTQPVAATSVEGIPVTAEASVDINLAVAAKPFTDWLASVDRQRFDLRAIHFQSIDMFGPRVGFIKFKVQVRDKVREFPPQVVFARGGSVAVLAVLVCEGKEYVVLTVQPRLATGKSQFEEVCAGMLDGSGNFAGVAAKELKEELGIELAESQLTNLSELSGRPDGLYLSPGACEETMRFFAFCRQVTPEQLADMNGRVNGVLEEGEQITLKIVELATLLTLEDAKSVLAYALFQAHKTSIAGALTA